MMSMRESERLPTAIAPRVVATPAAPRSAWLPSVVAILVATLLLGFWVLYVRSATDAQPLAWEPWLGLGFDAYYVGMATREIALPLVLLLLLSRTALFRRLVHRLHGRPGQAEAAASAADQYRIGALMVGILLLFLLSQFGLQSLSQDQTTVGFFILLLAGWLGGWQLGLITGLTAAVGIGVLDYFMWDWPDGFQLAALINYAVLQNLGAMGAIWVGFVAGHLCTLTPPRRRFHYGVLVGYMALLEVVVGVAVYLSSDWSGYYIERLIPMMTTSALAVTVFAIMVHFVQNDVARQQIEETRYQLAGAELALAQTRLALAQAELRALHAQINPHFFFNSLNTIRYFIRTDPQTARELLTHLSEIFQRVLSAGEFVTLGEEISHVEAYLALEQARLDERLTVIWSNLAKEQLDCAVPTLILQPLVENAVLHGISPKAAGGTVHIVINRVGGDLLLQVSDDGVGFDVTTYLPPNSADKGDDGVDEGGALAETRNTIGLHNIDNRLRMLYGPAYGLQLESSPTGTRVVLRIPLTAQTPYAHRATSEERHADPDR